MVDSISEPHSRVELAKFLGDQGFRTGAEIGVLMARFSEILFANIPDLKLYAVDNWKNIAHHKAIAASAKETLSKYNAVVIHKASMDAVREFEDNSLDFVYIDANHRYHSALDDITAWAKKVRIGGVICGDDYYHSPSGLLGVIEAVDEYVKVYDYELHLTGWDYNNPIREDQQPQFWWWKTHEAKRK